MITQVFCTDASSDRLVGMFSAGILLPPVVLRPTAAAPRCVVFPLPTVPTVLTDFPAVLSPQRPVWPFIPYMTFGQLMLRKLWPAMG